MAEITYECGFCAREFVSHKKRYGIKLCQNCIQLRRLIRRWVKQGIWVKEAKEPNN